MCRPRTEARHRRQDQRSRELTSEGPLQKTFFSKVARSVLRRIRVASKADLAERIRRYIEICNAAPLLPHWRHGITPDCQAQAA